MKTIYAHFSENEFSKLQAKKRKTAYNWHDFLMFKIVGELTVKQKLKSHSNLNKNGGKTKKCKEE